MGKNLGISRSWHTLAFWISLTASLNSCGELLIFPKSEVSAKREKNNKGTFFFFIVLPALAGIGPLCSLQAPQVKDFIPHYTWNFSKSWKLTTFLDPGISLGGAEPSEVLRALAAIQQSTQTPAYVSAALKNQFQIKRVLKCFAKEERGLLTFQELSGA